MKVLLETPGGRGIGEGISFLTVTSVGIWSLGGSFLRKLVALVIFPGDLKSVVRLGLKSRSLMSEMLSLVLSRRLDGIPGLTLQ